MDSGRAHFLVVRTWARVVLFVLGVLVVLSVPTGRAVAQPSLFVTSQFDHAVKEYDGTTGAFLRNAATGAGQPHGLGDPLDAIIGGDGNLLVTDGQQDVVKRFDRATGTYLGTFANAVSPQGMTISGGKVYVCQGNPPEIVRSFDASTGADAGSFLPTVGEGNPYPRDAKVANGRLYVAYWNLGTVETFDLTTRKSLGLLFPPGTGGLATPSSIAFGPDGNLYVAYSFFINRYHPTTGQFLGQFVDTGDRSGQRYAVGIAWGPDNNLYVSTQNTPGVQRYNGTTGAFMDDFVPPGSGGLGAPFHISFTPFDRLPDCRSARASPPRLWPPDRQLVPVEILGVTDPDNGRVTITVTAVTQDEPLHGDTRPDAVILDGQAWVRAERSGNGNGRVYAIHFRADDGQGGSCEGSVEVCVPHDHNDLTCIDDGQRYNSLGPGAGGSRLSAEAPNKTVPRERAR